MKRTYLHPLPLRLWHWANALVVVILIVTGVQLRISGVASLQPHDPFLLIHSFAGWAMTFSYMIWLAYSIASGNLRSNYLIRARELKGISSQSRFYLWSIFRGEKNPFSPSAGDRFNALQKIAYGSVMFILAPIFIITGLLYSDIEGLRRALVQWDVIGLINAIHIAAAYAIFLFLIIHLYMATLGPSPMSYIRAMITGYGEEHDDPVEEKSDAAAESGKQGV